MTKLKLSNVEDEKPVRITITLSAALHRDLIAYAEILARDSGKPVEPEKLIAPMLEDSSQAIGVSDAAKKALELQLQCTHGRGPRLRADVAVDLRARPAAVAREPVSRVSLQ